MTHRFHFQFSHYVSLLLISFRFFFRFHILSYQFLDSRFYRVHTKKDALVRTIFGPKSRITIRYCATFRGEGHEGI
jgi:hypothetical protein